jgi:hypothetical protein
MTCDPLVVEEKVYVAVPLDSASEEVSVVPSTSTVKVPVGVVAMELELEPATVIVIASLAPEAGAALAAVSVVVEAASDDPFDAGQLVIRL